MKLHLPKTLLAAVFATMATTAWADWGTDSLADTYYVNAPTIQAVNATGKGATITISPTGDVTESTISSVSLKNNDTLNISGNDGSNFDALTITSLSIGNGGNNFSILNVNENQAVALGGSNGKLRVNVDETGSLTLSGTHAYVEAYSGTTTVTGDTTVTTVDASVGGSATSAKGGILVKSGATLRVANYWDNNNFDTGILLEQGAKFVYNSNVNMVGLEGGAKFYAHKGNGKYTASNGDYTIENAQIKVANGGVMGNVLSNVDVLHDTNNTLTISNSASTINSVTVSNGKVILADLDASSNITAEVTGNGTLGLNHALAGLQSTGDGTVEINSGAELTGDASVANNLVLNATWKQTGGTFTHTGSSITIADIYGLDGGSYSEGENGFFGGTVYLIKGNVTTHVQTVGQYTIQSSDEGLYINVDADKSTYVVRSGTVNYGGSSAGTDIEADTTKTILMSGGTLNLNKDLADGYSIKTHKAAGSVINVAGGVTLANDSVSVENGVKSTLKGGEDAVYDLGSVTWNGSGTNGGQSANVVFGDEWKGTTVITNSTITNHQLDSFGSANSKIKLVGVTGWMAMSNTVNRELILENYVDANNAANNRSAFIFNDHSDNKTYTFAKKISGSGDFQIASAASGAANIVLSGDLSEWTGGIKVTNAYDATDTDTATITVKLNGGGQIFSATQNKGFVMDRSRTDDNTNTINLEIGNSGKESTMNGAIENTGNGTLNLVVTGKTSFKKAVNVDSLQVNDGTTAILEGTTTTGSLVGSYTDGSAQKTAGSVKVVGSGSLTYGGHTKVEALPAQTRATDVIGAEITSSAITGGVVTFTGESDVTETRTISGSAIVNNASGTANITVGAENVSVNAASGNIAMTADSTAVGALTVAADKSVSSTGALSVTQSLTLSSENALAITGALTLDGAEINLTGLTLRQDVTSYTLGTAASISAVGVTVNITEAQLIAAGFDKTYTANVGASVDNPEALVLTLTQTITDGTLTATSVNYNSTDKILTLGTGLTKGTFTLEATEDAKVDADLWQDAIDAIVKAEGGAAEVKVQFTYNNSDEVIDLEALKVQNLTINGMAAVEGTATIVGGTASSYLIPEPTTSTLSMLALAALAVRRRRR